MCPGRHIRLLLLLSTLEAAGREWSIVGVGWCGRSAHLHIKKKKKEKEKKSHRRDSFENPHVVSFGIKRNEVEQRVELA